MTNVNTVTISTPIANFTAHPFERCRTNILKTFQPSARRRQLDNERRGISSTIESLMEDIARRDKYDSEREASPLVQAVDAIYLDTTNLSIEEAANEILRLANERMV